MSLKIFSEKLSIVNEVIRLAKKKRLEYEKESEATSGQSISDALRQVEESIKADTFSEERLNEDALQYYLLSLDFEFIKHLQALMYLGRDRDYEEEESYEARYAAVYDSLNKDSWNTKEIEVSQMTQKMPLDLYLTQGLEIVGIR